MIQKAFHGGKSYWLLMGLLGAVAAAGVFCYLRQLEHGLSVTGMGRDVSWGLYIAQFTFFVGVAASAVTVVLPYYLHDFRAFGKITVLGEFLAVASVAMCVLFIFVDLGQPFRVLNVFLHPSPTSPMFWDTVVLSGYLAINLIISWTVLGAVYRDTPPPRWVKPLIYLSIPWAVSIHTVTAFLYAGLPGRHLWFSAITAARFLASAFSSGPSLLILLCLAMRRFADFNAGREAVGAMARIVAYSFSAHVFFILLEIFTGFYGGIRSHREPFIYLFAGLDGKSALAPFMWAAAATGATGLLLFIVPKARENKVLLPIAAGMVFISVWIEKGFGFVTGGFVPSPAGNVTEYLPTVPEVLVTAGVWAAGSMLLAALYRVFIAVRREA